MGKLTTHVLDTANGCPAVGMRVALYRLVDDQPVFLREAVTNHDGRVDAPLVEGDELVAGVYRLAFDAGEYFDRKGLSLPEPRFVGRVVLDFGVADPAQHYHVPLLVGPWNWSTYRGS